MDEDKENHFTMQKIPMPKMWVRCVIISILIFTIGGTVLYYTVFVHPPVDDILAANRKGRNLAAAGRLNGLKEEDFYIYFDGDEPDAIALTQAKWDLWIKVNNHIDIGNIWLNTCEKGPNRTTIGKVIMVPDLVLGGIKSQSYGNFTLDHEITDGELFVDIYYNGKSLYYNHFPLCTVEERVPEEPKIFKCPIKPGKKRYVKNMKIPNLLPKGTYTTKTWITDQNDDMIGCGWCEFTL